jgi:hypothetical protein
MATALFLAIFMFISITVVHAVLQQQDATLFDREGFVIGTLKPQARVLVTSTEGSMSNILVSGWVDNRFLPTSNSLAEVEQVNEFFFGSVSFQDLFGNSSRLIGVLENLSDECFSSMNMEASLWNPDGSLAQIVEFRVWQIPPGSRVPFQTDRIFVTVEESEELLLRMRFLNGSGCASEGGGGGGGGPSDF